MKIDSNVKACPEIPLMIEVTLAPRLLSMTDLMEGRLLNSLQQKLRMITEMTIEMLLHDSHLIRSGPRSENLWVTRVSYDQRLIFRRTGIASIEAIDIVSHEDLNKFVGMKP